MPNTHISLVNDLRNLIFNDDANIPAQRRTDILMIANKAARGHYHDYLSPLATPKMQLVDDLMNADLVDFAELVKEGEYDAESPTDSILQMPRGAL